MKLGKLAMAFASLRASALTNDCGRLDEGNSSNATATHASATRVDVPCLVGPLSFEAPELATNTSPPALRRGARDWPLVWRLPSLFAWKYKAYWGRRTPPKGMADQLGTFAGGRFRLERKGESCTSKTFRFQIAPCRGAIVYRRPIFNSLGRKRHRT